MTAKERENIIEETAKSVDLADDSVIIKVSHRHAEVICENTGVQKAYVTWVHNSGYTTVTVHSKYGRNIKKSIKNNDDFRNSSTAVWNDLISNLETDFE